MYRTVDVEDARAGAVPLDPGFEAAGPRVHGHRLERALGRSRAERLLPARAVQRNVHGGREPPGREMERDVERPARATWTCQKPRSFGFQPASGPRQSWRVRTVGFSRVPPSSIGRRIESAGGRDVLEPGEVVLVHLGDDVAVAGGDVLELERVVLHVEKLERRRLGARDRLAAQQLVGLRPRGERAAGLGLVAAVPLKVERAVGPAGGLLAA